MDVIAIHAERQPERATLIEGERRLSWRELRDVRNRLAHSRVALGLRPGEHVVIYAFNCLEALIASAVVRAAGFLPMEDEVRARASTVRAWVLMGAERRPWAAVLEELIAAGRPEPVALPGGQVFGASTIYTAGTTGKPKGVRWTPASGVSFREALPRDSVGKLVKRLLREPYWVGRAPRV